MVFEDGGDDRIVFPSLKSICLVGLPKLQSICSGSLPKLEKLKVSGCLMLKKLPLHVNKNPNATPLEIIGEKIWWDNIIGDGRINRPTSFSNRGIQFVSD